jgi:hypothetical protein
MTDPPIHTLSRRADYVACHLLSRRYLARIIRPWRSRQSVPPKTRMTFFELYGVISQAMGLFIKTTAVRTSNSTCFAYLVLAFISDKHNFHMYIASRLSFVCCPFHLSCVGGHVFNMTYMCCFVYGLVLLLSLLLLLCCYFSASLTLLCYVSLSECVSMWNWTMRSWVHELFDVVMYAVLQSCGVLWFL